MGAETLANYSLDIFRRANVKLNNYLLVVLVQGCTLTGYIISACIMRYVKRKHHFACSAALMSISYAVLGIALKMQVKRLNACINISQWTEMHVLLSNNISMLSIKNIC